MKRGSGLPDENGIIWMAIGLGYGIPQPAPEEPFFIYGSQKGERFIYGPYFSFSEAKKDWLKLIDAVRNRGKQEII